MRSLIQKCVLTALLFGLSSLVVSAQDGDVIFERTVGDQVMTVSVERTETIIYRHHHGNDDRWGKNSEFYGKSA